MGGKSSKTKSAIDSMLKREILKLFALPSNVKKKGRKDYIGINVSDPRLSSRVWLKWSIYWIRLGKNLVIQKEIFLSSFCKGSGLRSINPVCTSNLEDTIKSWHDFPTTHLLIGTNREHDKTDHIGGYSEPVLGVTKFLCQRHPLSSHNILFSITWHW